MILLCAFAYALLYGTVPSPIVMFPFIYWGGLYVVQFAGFSIWQLVRRQHLGGCLGTASAVRMRATRVAPATSAIEAPGIEQQLSLHG